MYDAFVIFTLRRIKTVTSVSDIWSNKQKNSHQAAKKRHEDLGLKLGCAWIAIVFLSIAGCTAQLFTHPGGLDYKGPTPEFGVAFKVICASSVIIGLAMWLSSLGVQNTKSKADPMSKDYEPTCEADRLNSLAMRRGARHPSCKAYKVYLGRFNWAKITGYQKYLYRHIIELEELRGSAQAFGAASDSSLKLSSARAQTRDPYIAGGMAQGLFGTAAGLAAYSSAVVDNARAEAQAKIDRKNNFDKAVALEVLGSQASQSANRLERVIDSFKTNHKIGTSDIKKPTFKPVYKQDWNSDIKRGIVKVTFIASIKDNTTLFGREAVYDGTFLVVMEYEGNQIGKGFLLGGCPSDGTGSVRVDENPLDPEPIIKSIRSQRRSTISGGGRSLNVSIGVVNSEEPRLDNAGFRDGKEYDAIIMLEDGVSQVLDFEQLSFDISPVGLWKIQL